MSAVLAADDPLPDCVFAVTDVMAMGALARLRPAACRFPPTSRWPGSTTSGPCGTSTRR